MRRDNGNGVMRIAQPNNRPARLVMRDRVGMGRPGTRAIMRDNVMYNRRVPGRSMRDATPLTSPSNSIGQQQSLTQFGWIGPAIGTLGNTSRWSCSLNPDNEIVAAQGYPLATLATTPAALLNAAMIAVAGSAGKTATSAVWDVATPAAVSLDLTINTTIAFGARVKISNSINDFTFATYEIQLAQDTTVLSYIWVEVTSLPVDIIILAINFNAGQATIVGDSSPHVIFPYSTTPGDIGNLNAASFQAADVLYAETLNMRDIGNIYDAVQSGAIIL